MSALQKLLVCVLPQAWAENMEADSRAWRMACSCGCTRSIWELGGVRWKASRSRTYSFMQCPECGKRSWHKLVREGERPR